MSSDGGNDDLWITVRIIKIPVRGGAEWHCLAETAENDGKRSKNCYKEVLKEHGKEERC